MPQRSMSMSVLEQLTKIRSQLLSPDGGKPRSGERSYGHEKQFVGLSQTSSTAYQFRQT